MEEDRQDHVIELVALRVLATAIRCRRVDGGGPTTYRKALDGVVPGMTLTVAVTREWSFRRTRMVGGPITHAGFSVRALWRAGFELPRLESGHLRSPGENDPRLRDALLRLETGGWLDGRCQLLDVVEDRPGCLLAHARLGDVLAAVLHRTPALAHYTAAIRLGLGALDRDDCLPLRADRLVEGALLRALVGRARLLAEGGDARAARCDLRRAVSWDPADDAGAARLLETLEEPSRQADHEADRGRGRTGAPPPAG